MPAALPTHYPRGSVMIMEKSLDRPGPTAAPRRFGQRALLTFKSIRAKTTIYVLVLLSGTIAVSYVITLRIMDNHIKGEIVKRAESLSRSIASAAGYNLILKDLLALDNMVYKIKDSNPDITSIAILGTDRKAIVHSDTGRAGATQALSGGRIVATALDGTSIREIATANRSSFAVESPIVFVDKPISETRGGCEFL